VRLHIRRLRQIDHYASAAAIEVLSGKCCGAVAREHEHNIRPSQIAKLAREHRSFLELGHSSLKSGYRAADQQEFDFVLCEQSRCRYAD
jgi:hypothetical protein